METFQTLQTLQTFHQVHVATSRRYSGAAVCMRYSDVVSPPRMAMGSIDPGFAKINYEVV